MTKKLKKQILDHFGGYQGLATAISNKYGDISRQAVAQWEIVPVRRAYEIEYLSNGKFKKEKLRPDIF